MLVQLLMLLYCLMDFVSKIRGFCPDILQPEILGIILPHFRINLQRSFFWFHYLTQYRLERKVLGLFQGFDGLFLQDRSGKSDLMIEF